MGGLLFEGLGWNLGDIIDSFVLDRKYLEEWD